MSYSKITLRYAQALFELADEKKLVEEVRSDMELLARVCASNRDFRAMLSNPVISADKKQKVTVQLFGTQISKLSLRFMVLLIKKRREHYLQPITEAFSEIYKESKGIKTAFVSSVVKLGDTDKKKVLGILATMTDRQIDLVESLDPKLIGGFVINVDDFQIDQSLYTKIKELKKDFDKNLFIKGY